MNDKLTAFIITALAVFVALMAYDMYAKNREKKEIAEMEKNFFLQMQAMGNGTPAAPATTTA